MKKIFLLTIMLIFTNTSISFAGQFKSKWGVVISVTPISITTNYSEPYTKVSHYNIKVRTKRRILNIQSTTPYNVHDVIYLN